MKELSFFNSISIVVKKSQICYNLTTKTNKGERQLKVVKCPHCEADIVGDINICPSCKKRVGRTKGLFNRIFGKSKIDIDDNVLKMIDEFNSFFDKLIEQNTYISGRMYLSEIERYKDIYNFLKISSKKIQSEEKIRDFLDTYGNFKNIIKDYNNNYVERKLEEEKEYLDHILDDDNKNIKLDAEQRRAILVDEDYCLVVAGAGAGKTTTVAAKVKYLVDRKGVNPEDILVISYTNKAVNELKDRIQKKLKLNVQVVTFHKVGKDIISGEKDVPQKIIGYNFKIINKYLLNLLSQDEELLRKIVMLFGYYLDIPDNKYNIDNIEKFFDWNERQDLTTLKGNLGEVNEYFIDAYSRKKITIKNEVLRSIQEVQIANFLYLHNIDYIYEKPYKYKILGASKIYTPDFYISQGGKECYIEHFGISESGKNEMYSFFQLNTYKKQIEDKKQLHKKYGTELICTYSSYNDKRSLIEHLREELLKRGFALNKKTDQEVYQKIVKLDQEKYILRLATLASRFLSNFKVYGYTEEDFDKMRLKTNNVRTRLFLDILEKVYLHYQSYLKENNAIDFDDMINDSERLLNEMIASKRKLHYQYIFVDEYQDISHQRFNLAKSLTQVSDAKLVAVGDDWQSIFAFSGADVSLFVDFVKNMGYGEELKITNTYRNGQELIDIAGNFIQKNTNQIKKSLKSPKRIKKPIVVFTYSDDYQKNVKKGWAGILYEKAKTVEKVIGLILQVPGTPPDTEILLIGRYGFDGDHLVRSELFKYYGPKKERIICVKYPEVKLTFMTAHSSKGLGYDNVIIINAIDGTYGFPSQIEDDPVLKMVIRTDSNIEFAEERRLFYVALTRTKNRVFIVAPANRPSRFLLELINEHKITVHGKINTSPIKIKKQRKRCPICGYPLRLQNNKTYGLRLYICINEPEICGFMTNDLRAGAKGNIHCCEKCNGYMVVRKRNNGDSYFLGCTNWNKDGTGCNNVENIE